MFCSDRNDAGYGRNSAVLTVQAFLIAKEPVMSGHVEKSESSHKSEQSGGLPIGLDCETMTLLRCFLMPIMETASDWCEMVNRFRAKGYGIGLRGDRLVVLNEAGEAICTGSSLGMPLVSIMRRIGPPSHSLPRV